jgi:hypothetical protein
MPDISSSNRIRRGQARGVRYAGAIWHSVTTTAGWLGKAGIMNKHGIDAAAVARTRVW